MSFFSNDPKIRETHSVLPNNNIYLMDVRVYIAGVLVPTLNVTVTAGIETPPKATFSMPPYPELMEVGRRDRIPVQIFFKDTFSADYKMHLLFDGYIESVHYVSTPQSRQITFGASGWMQVFDSFKFLEVDSLTGAFLNGVNNTSAVSASVDSMLMGLWDQIILETNKVPCQLLDTLFKFIEDLLKTQGEKTVYAKYYTPLIKNLKMRERMCGVACVDDYAKDAADVKKNLNTTELSAENTVFPVLYAIQNGTAEAFIKKSASNAAAQGYTLFEIIQALMGTFDFEFLNISTPAYHKKKMDKLKNSTEPCMASMCFKPNLSSSHFVPYCNVIFRSQAMSLAAQEVFENSPTRVRCKNAQGAMARLMGEGANSAIGQAMITDIYPSYSNGNTGTYINRRDGLSALVDELIEGEKYGGPHIIDVNVPMWYDNYSANNATDKKDKESETIIERYMRRMLIESIYSVRTLAIEEVFNPYIQPGFPAAVFDGGDTGMSFAGYVTSVEHAFSQGRANTTVTMSYVRTLQEAASTRIPAPVDTIRKLVHKKEYMEKMVFSILGDGPDTDKVGGNTENIDCNVGCNIISYKKLYKAFTPVETLNKNTNPQHSLPAAYKLQKRNIITLDDYLTFNNMIVDKSVTTEDGEVIPTVYTSKFLSDRYKLNTNKALWEKKLEDDPTEDPPKETAAPVAEFDDDDFDGEEELTETETSKEPTATDAAIEKDTSSQHDSGTITYSAQMAESEIMANLNADYTARQAGGTNQLYMGKTEDVRVLLYAIAEIEFSRKPYATPTSTGNVTETEPEVQLDLSQAKGGETA